MISSSSLGKSAKKNKAHLRKIDGEYCSVLPREAVELAGVLEGQELQIEVDSTGIEIISGEATSNEAFDQQLAAARFAMRKYRVALSKLAQE